MSITNVPGSPPLLRRLNSALVLRAIRESGPISRGEIARATGLSRPTVNEIADVLLRARYADESTANGEVRPRRPGPPARLLRFRADLTHVLGIDIGANKILATVADLSGAILAMERRSTAGRDDLDAPARLDEVRAASTAALAAAGVELRELGAVGVGTPGIVDPAGGQVRLAPQLDGWERLRLASALESGFPCPVLVDNEVHLAVLAERWRGAAQGVDDAVYVHVGVGIGAGILIGGELYRGAGGAAGEVGYLPLGEDRPPRKPDLGPFELAAGGRAFARLGSEAARGDAGALLRELAGGGPAGVDAEVVFEAARRGDAAAAGIVDELVSRLARGIASLVVVLNPETVIVGGGLSRAGATLLDPLERGVTDLVPRAPRVVLSELGDEAVALGAVRLAITSVEDRLFAFEELTA